jgi:hypothetical protein
MMQIPVSEAFQDGRQEVTLELDSDQIQWLNAKAEEHDVSPDQVVRYLINAQIRGDESLPTDLHQSAPPEDASPAGASGPEEDAEKQSSILEDLRDASNMLNDLTSNDEPSSESGADRPDASNRSRPPTGAELSASDPDAEPDASPRRSRPTDFFPDDLPGEENGATGDEPEDASDEPESMFNMVDDDADDETDDGA